MSFLDFGTTDSKSSAFLLPSLASPNPSHADPTAAADARDAADEEAILQEFKSNPKAALALAKSYAAAAHAPRQAMTEITSVPGFVLQTHTTKESNKVPIGANKDVVFSKDTLIFINVCSSDLMPKPTKATEAEIRRAINAEEGVNYQVPFQLSPPREYRDSLTKPYLVVDACIHTEPYKRTESDFDYKLYIMELAMEWVEEKCRIELSRNFELPNLKSKDELKKRPVILPKPPAIQEVDDTDRNQTATALKAKNPTATKTAVVISTNAKRAKEDAAIVPTAGKDDIVLKSRLLPCTKGTLGIIVEIDLPNHSSMDGVTLDVVLPDKLVLHSKSQGQAVDQGKEYHMEVDMPNEPLDIDAVYAEFSKLRQTLRVYTLKKRRN